MTPSFRSPVPVILVEDHEPTRRAIARTLRDSPDRVEFIAAFPSGEALGAFDAELDGVVALVDLRLSGMSGARVISWLTAHHPRARSIALTVQRDEQAVLEAVRAGALGYVLKDEPTERLMVAIEDAAAGRHPFSSQVAGALLRSLEPQPACLLTDRELDLVAALVRGESYAQCAESLSIRLGTVQSHVKNVYGKLGINSRSELREWARRHLK